MCRSTDEEPNQRKEMNTGLTLMNILVRELQTNPTLLTETLFPPHVWKAFYQLVEAINALDPNGVVMVYLRDCIEQGYGALIETSASLKHEKVELLRSLGGLSYSTAFDQVPCGAGVYLWNAIADGSQYVGSTVNFYERTVSRIYTLTHPPYNAIAEFGLNHGGLDAWLWGIIYDVEENSPRDSWFFPRVSLSYGLLLT